MKIMKKNELYYIAGGNAEDNAMRRKGIREIEGDDGSWIIIKGKDTIVIFQGTSKY